MKRVLSILVLLFAIGFPPQEVQAQAVDDIVMMVVDEPINYSPETDVTLAYDSKEQVFYSKKKAFEKPTASPTQLSGEQLEEVCCKTCGPCEPNGIMWCTDSTDYFWGEPCRYTPPKDPKQ
tara:strand:+ start:7961 stop:8323 length:363 start_codon:yes stop_codon:yes gene_type:complete